MTDEQLDEVLRALAHSARRAILRACTAAPRFAGELTEMLDLSPATVSEHLRVLRKTGLVQMAQDGRHRYFRAVPEVVESAGSALTAVVAPTPAR